jgi:hypothetical protein
VRTTLTLDPDVARLLDEAMHRERKPFKQVVNEAIRRGLASRPAHGARTRYRVRVHDSALLPGIDAEALNRLADTLEDETTWAKAMRDDRGGRAGEPSRRGRSRKR